MNLSMDLNASLRDYDIDGDLNELWSFINTCTRIFISVNDIKAVLVANKPNIIRIGQGDTLAQAYNDGLIKDKTCKLVHICFHPGDVGLSEFMHFIESIDGGDLIFGYSIDTDIDARVKLMMIFN